MMVKVESLKKKKGRGPGVLIGLVNKGFILKSYRSLEEGCKWVLS